MPNFNYKNFFYELTKIPFIENNQIDYGDKLKQKFVKEDLNNNNKNNINNKINNKPITNENNNYIKFYNYYKHQWYKYLRNGYLNYTKINRIFFSNSYLENFNRIIKMKISKYLYGNLKTKISWPLFIEFICNEEEEYRLKTYKEENKIIKKSKISNQIIHNKFIKDIEDNENDKDNILRIFLNWHENSCRYYLFFSYFAL